MRILFEHDDLTYATVYRFNGDVYPVLALVEYALLPLLRSEMESTRQHKTWSTRVFCICINKFYRRSGSAFEPDNASVGLNPTF